MAKKRKNAHTPLEISTIEADDPRITFEKKEMIRLTKAAKSWEFTCSFCFKKFASAQAMGGHKNAHRGERLEEKRLFVRDPIGYRKRAFLRAVKADRPVKMAELNGGGGGGPPRATDSRESNGDCSRCEDSSVVKVDGGNGNFVVMNLLSPKEVSVDESVGDGIDLDLTLKL